MEELHARDQEIPDRWWFSPLDPPGLYRRKNTGRVFWSGAPRYIQGVTAVEGDLQAEWNALALLRTWGFEVGLTLLNYIAIDIRGPKILAQVKHETEAIGRPHLFFFYEACQLEDPSKERWYFSGSAYRKTAIEYADHRSILLFTYDLEGVPAPVNQIAKDRYDRLMARLAVRRRWRDANRRWRVLAMRARNTERVFLDENATWQDREAAAARYEAIKAEMEILLRQKEVLTRSLREGWLDKQKEKQEVGLMAPVIPTGAFSISEEVA